MLKCFKLSLVLFLGLFINAKQITSEENKNSNSRPDILLKNGYVKAEIIYKKKRKTRFCLTVIRLVNNGELLDPINLENKYLRLKNNSDVWLKFSPSRMRNRCSEARPVIIIDIKERDH